MPRNIGGRVYAVLLMVGASVCVGTPSRSSIVHADPPAPVAVLGVDPPVSIGQLVGDASTLITAGPSGTYYVGHRNRIYQVAADGSMTHIAGTGGVGYTGTTGLATSISLDGVRLLTTTPSGTILFATGTYIVKIVGTTLSAVAGNGIFDFDGNQGNGGPATSASLGSLAGLTGDSAGNVYFAEFGVNQVRRVNTSGTLNPYAGNGAADDSCTSLSGTALSRPMMAPTSLAVDASNNLSFSVQCSFNDMGFEDTDHRLVRVTSAGVMSVIAGGGVADITDGATATAVRLVFPTDVSFVGTTMYFRTTSSSALSIVGGVIDVVAGAKGGDPCAFEDGTLSEDVCVSLFAVLSTGAPLIKDFFGPIGLVSGGELDVLTSDGDPLDGSVANESGAINLRSLAVNPDGSLAFTTATGFRIRKVSTAGVVGTTAGTIGGSGAALPGYSGAANGVDMPIDARVSRAPNGDLLVWGQSMLSRVASGQVTPVAGNGVSASAADGPSATAGAVVTTAAVQAANGDVMAATLSYGICGSVPSTFACVDGAMVRRITSAGALSTVMPRLATVLEFTDLAFSASNELILAPSTGGALLRLNVSTGATTEVPFEVGDRPRIAIDPAGTIFIANSVSLSSITSTGTVETIAATGSDADVDIDADGNVYLLTDSAIRKFPGLAAPVPDPVPSFTALAAPVRLLDTRATKLGSLEQPTGSIGSDVVLPLAANVAQRYVVTDASGIPATVAGLAMNVTAIAPQGGGFVKVYGCAAANDAPPATSALNYQSGVTLGNGAIVAPHASGGVCVISSQSTHIALDVSGFFAIGSGFNSLTSPVRLLDTRGTKVGVLEEPSGSIGDDIEVPLEANIPQRYVVTNTSGIPVSVAGLAMNVTAINPGGGGFVKVYGCASTADPAPPTSSLNYRQGVTLGNGAIVAPGAGGGVCLLSSQSTHVALDVSGYFSSGFSPVPPVRLLDTREAKLGALEQPTGSIGSDVTVALAANVVQRYVVTNTSGIPVSVAGLAINVTAIGPGGGGFVKVYGCASTAATQPATSALNYQSGITLGNGAIVAPGTGGGICVVSSQNTHLALDASGFFATVAA